MESLPEGYRAVVAGSTGGIGKAFVSLLTEDKRCGEVVGISRSTDPRIDFTDEESIANAAHKVGGEIQLFIDATGFLSNTEIQPEKSLRQIKPENLATLYEVNAIGPILLLKHFSNLFPRKERAIFSTLSARVGSIGDNRIGGWHAYRAAKSALNMLVKGASIELSRNKPESVCVSLHPGTVETQLSDPFAGNRDRFTPEHSALQMLNVIDGLSPQQTGSFFAYDGSEIVW